MEVKDMMNKLCIIQGQQTKLFLVVLVLKVVVK
jgi:hypothetical protein